MSSMFLPPVSSERLTESRSGLSYPAIDRLAHEALDELLQRIRRGVGVDAAWILLEESGFHWFGMVGNAALAAALWSLAGAATTDDARVLADVRTIPAWSGCDLPESARTFRSLVICPLRGLDGRSAMLCLADAAARDITPAQHDTLQGFAGLAESMLRW